MPKITRDPDARTEHLTLRVSQATKDRLDERAEAEGTTVANLIRPSIEAIAAKGEPEAYPWPIGQAMTELAEFGVTSVDSLRKAHDLGAELERLDRHFEIEALGDQAVVVRVINS